MISNIIPVEIDKIKRKKLFSICTLVTDKKEYKKMLNSFNKAGFTKKYCEYLYIDNTLRNKYDAYQGLTNFLNVAVGKYIILCHQDILVKYDNKDDLLSLINEVEIIDANWGVLGNAGYKNVLQMSVRITDPYGENQSSKIFPQKIRTLDENFLVVNNTANLAVSNNIRGFHLYGSDLCIIADILGYSSYVINFHAYHKSGGNADNIFLSTKKSFVDKYQKKLRARFLRTTSTYLFISNSKIKNWFFNKKIGISLKKKYEILKKYIKI